MNPTLFQRLLTLLHIRGVSGGLEITDTMLRFAWSTGGAWHFAGVRIPPGVVVQGRVADITQFTEALWSLREQIFGSRKKDTLIHTVVSIGSLPVYMQVFSLPLLSGKQLDEAITLNLAVASPMEAGRAYMGWQIAATDDSLGKMDLLSAFIDRTIVDSYIVPLKEAGFLAAVAEPHTISLARLVRTMGAGQLDPAPRLILIEQEEGIDMIIMKNGILYFHYFVAWGGLETDTKEIPWESFSIVFKDQFKKVINFYASHFSGSISSLTLIAPALSERLAPIITNEFGIEVLQFAMEGGANLTPEWFAPLGAGIRSTMSLREDKELSLLGNTAREEYVRLQTLKFLGFWRVAFPIWLVVLLVIAFGANSLVVRNRDELEGRAALVSGSDEIKQIVDLTAKAKEFNTSVMALGTAVQTDFDIPNVEKVRLLLNAHEASFTSLTISPAGQVSLAGQISSEEKLLELADTIKKNPEYSSLSLPLQGVVSNERGISFSMSFMMIVSNTP